ncbi:hypothetical protein D9M71_266720 [compost metagenome]
MKFRARISSLAPVNAPVGHAKPLSLKVASWLLDSPRLGDKPSIKHFAGRLLKQPARDGVVEAQSRLGQMLCRDCDNARDRRIGQELLRQAARAGDRRAQLEFGRLGNGTQSDEAEHDD